MDHLALAARLEVLKWRDAQFEAVWEQLEAALPSLLADVSEMIEQASVVELVKTSFVMRRAVETSVQAWSAEQARIALNRAQIALDTTLSGLGAGLRLDSGMRDTMLAGLRAGSGVTMIAGSLLVIPSLIAYATVTTGMFGFFATSTLSIPVLAVGALGIGAAALTGSTVLRRAVSSARVSLRERVVMAVERQVMGYGLPLGARSVLSDIQSMVLISGEQRIGGKA